MEEDNIKPEKAVTIKDIAKITGTSYTTVSRALNNKYGVHEKTRQLINEAAAKMSYQPNDVARNLVLKHTKTIGLIIPDVTNPFFADIVYSVENYCTNKGYSVIITNTNWREELEKIRFEVLVRSRVDGIILKSAVDKKNIPYNYPTSLPIVVLSSSLDIKKNLSCVDYDDELGGYLATEHLIKTGYKKIAYISGEANACSSIGRFQGFKTALKKYNMPIFSEYILYGSFTIESGIDNAKKLLALPSPPDSVFCGNDFIALGVAQHVIEAGMSIPEQFGIIGYDDIYYSSLPQIQLTTVAQQRSVMGNKAAELLIAQIESSGTKEPEKIILKPHVVERNTTQKGVI